MSKKVLFAFMFGYLLRTFQKGFIWRGAKQGFTKSFLKIMRDDFPKLAEDALSELSPEQRARAEAKLRGL